MEEVDTEVPPRIQALMRPSELEHMKDRNGWALGTVVLINGEGAEAKRLDDAWIELFNGAAGTSAGGVKFLWADPDIPRPGSSACEWLGEIDDDPGYMEAYAFGSHDAAQQAGTPPYWYVESFVEPDVDVGDPMP